MSYVAGPQATPRRVELRNGWRPTSWNRSAWLSLSTIPRFTDLTRDHWERVIRQMACSRPMWPWSGASPPVKPRPVSKATRADACSWVVAGSSMTKRTKVTKPTSRFRISPEISRASTCSANSVMAATRNGNPVCVPYHVNVLYGGWDDLNRQADPGCVSARLAWALVRDILAYWRRLSQDTSLRTSFRLDVTQVIPAEALQVRAKTAANASCRKAAGMFMKNFRVYVSVSSATTLTRSNSWPRPRTWPTPNPSATS